MFPKAVEELITNINRLPGIGRKSAIRIALYLLTKDTRQAEALTQSLKQAKQEVALCQRCSNLAETTAKNNLCHICSDPERDQTQIMIVESALDLLAFEQTQYKGVYQVLGGLISPLHGLGPGELKIEQLLERLKKQQDEVELIFSLPTSLEGETTVTYIENIISRSYSNKRVRISRLARGLPSNSGLDYQDTQTLQQALTNRIPDLK